MKRRILALARPAVIIGAALIIAVTMIRSRPQPQPRSVDMPLPLVQVETVRTGDVPVVVVAHGNVRAWRELDLAAQVTGRIIWQSPNFEPGVVVAAEAPLLRIDPTDYQLALAEAKQARASAELSLADARALRQTAREEEAQTMVEAARARIKRAERDLKNTEIRAPYNAVVDSQNVEVGQYVAVGTTVGRILGSDRAEIRLPITQQDIGFVDINDERPVHLTTEVGQHHMRWEGKLTRVEARIDEQTRVFPIVVAVEEPLNAQRHEQALPFGLFVRAEVQGHAVSNAVEIPQAALHGDNDVFLFEDGRLTRRSVTVERLSARGALVSQGLEDGDKLVVTRLDLMFEGMQVALIDG